MRPELQDIFDSTPEDEARSKLEPYRELILRWRRQGRSYRTICTLLADKCGMEVGKTALNKFVKRRSRPRTPDPRDELRSEAPGLQNQRESLTLEPRQELSIRKRLTAEEIAHQRGILRAIRNKPVLGAVEQKPFFTYDPSKPLTNKPSSEEK